ncbi:MAG: hypothetical protein K0Q94_6073, partial [Paenibacillus sp.]|nr:hypothetical protein [Paenibacillus sp.]
TGTGLPFLFMLGGPKCKIGDLFFLQRAFERGHRPFTVQDELIKLFGSQYYLTNIHILLTSMTPMSHSKTKATKL